MRAPVPLVLFAAASLSCSSPESARGVASSAASVVVESSGAPIALDPGALRARKADFEDADHRGFWLSSLAPAYGPKVGVEVEDAEGRRVLLAPAGGDPEEREAAVMVNQQGELKVVLASRQDPLPAFHGRGGNRGRSGDSARVREARRIFLVSATSSGTEVAP